MLKHKILVGYVNEDRVTDYDVMEVQYFNEIGGIQGNLNPLPEGKEDDRLYSNKDIGVCYRSGKATLVWIYPNGSSEMLGYYLDIPDELEGFVEGQVSSKPEEPEQRELLWEYLEKLLLTFDSDKWQRTHQVRRGVVNRLDSAIQELNVALRQEGTDVEIKVWVAPYSVHAKGCWAMEGKVEITSFKKGE